MFYLFILQHRVRERNRPAHLDEMDAARQSAGTEGSRKPPRSMKLPKSMRLPRMQPWYFFNEERLVQLQQMVSFFIYLFMFVILSYD